MAKPEPTTGKEPGPAPVPLPVDPSLPLTGVCMSVWILIDTTVSLYLSRYGSLLLNVEDNRCIYLPIISAYPPWMI